jgi:hypothetical protein
MSAHKDLWEYAEEGAAKQQAQEGLDKDESRRITIKRLRSSGHWLTLLRVARTIPQPFTLNDISVAVWRACPEFFGMKGYPYPDNHKVHYILYGDRGLIAKGMVQRVQQGLFRLPDGIDLEEPGSQGQNSSDTSEHAAKDNEPLPDRPPSHTP